MARPSYADTLKRHQGAFSASRKWRNQEELDDLWRRMVDLYRGRHYGRPSKEDRAIVNMAFSTKNVISPSVAVNNPRFSVQARRPEKGPHAIITQEILNYVWRSNKYQDEFRLAVDDFIIMGHGWIKVGFKASTPKVVKKVEGEGEADDCEDPEGVIDADPSLPSMETSTYEPDEDQRPFCERVSPFDMFVDPHARRPREMKWIAQRIRRPLNDAKVDERYLASVRSKLKASSKSKLDDEEHPDHQYEIEPEHGDEYVDIIEFYDIRKGQMCVFADGCSEGYLVKPQPIPFAFGHPFVMLRNYEVPDHFYPMGELEQVEILQHELNETRSQMMNHRKRFARKWLYRRDAFNQPDSLAALESDEDNTMVPVDIDDNEPIDNVISPMPAVGTPPDFYNQSELIQSDMDKVTGVSDYMRGDAADIRRTATEAAMIQDSMNSRSADKLSTIEGTLAEVGERLIGLMQQFLTGEHVIRVVGMSAMPIWLQYDREYIQGKFDFEVEAGSTQPRNESFRRQSAREFAEVMAPFIGGGIVDPGAVARELITAFGFKDPQAFMAPPAPAPPSADPSADPVEGQPPVGAEPQAPVDPMAGIPPELISQLVGQPAAPVPV